MPKDQERGWRQEPVLETESLCYWDQTQEWNWIQHEFILERDVVPESLKEALVSSRNYSWIPSY